MYEIRLKGSFEDWREKARDLLKREISPERLIWKNRGESDDFFAQELPDHFNTTRPQFSVPRDFMERSVLVSAHRGFDRWALLYRILWRITHGEPDLLKIAIDSDTEQFNSYERLVRRDLHKMKAFVRFREIDGHFIAWHEPDHLILKLAAPFFRDRFQAMSWSILTPDESVHWNQKEIVFGVGCSRASAPSKDEMETLWKTYYASIFNPSRMKIGAMKKEMAVRYWKNLPEAELISGLISQAPSRLQAFYQSQSAGVAPLIAKIEKPLSIDALQVHAKDCRACGICEKATQTVFGQGPSEAQIVIVGEQPGDEEDLKGSPFVGPAGKLLDQILNRVGADRSEIYITNAVKHFKWTPQGKRRLHQRPTSSEIATCKPWLVAELQVIKPRLLICLGATAAQSVMGKAVKIADVRGRRLESAYCENTWVTIHPSAILRTLDPAARESETEAFCGDLERALQSTGYEKKETRTLGKHSSQTQTD